VNPFVPTCKSAEISPLCFQQAACPVGSELDEAEWPEITDNFARNDPVNRENNLND
jgi:hypothetical protein